MVNDFGKFETQVKDYSSSCSFWIVEKKHINHGLPPLIRIKEVQVCDTFRITVVSGLTKLEMNLALDVC